MQLGTADQVIQRTQLKLNVAVLKKTVDGIEHKIKGKHVFTYAKDDERQGVEKKLKGFCFISL